METVLALQNADVGYDRRRPPILADVALQVQAGEFVGVIGPNGAGKSTLVRALSRVLAPLAGAALLDGRDLYAQVSARQSAQSIGVVPQTASAILEFSVREIVEMGRAPHLAARPFAALSPQDTRIVDDALRAAGVETMADRLAPTLSGGEWQRVLLARALAQQPDALLLDEPTAHLDLHHQRQVLALARTLAHDRGKAVLAVLHDLNLAAEFCDTLYLVDAGRVVAAGTPEDVLTTATLAAVYRSPVWVRRHPLTGRPLLLSVPENLPGSLAPNARTAHVLCGLGTGAALLFALKEAGWRVTCDVLADGDPDADAARRLDIPFPRLLPFTAPSAPLLAEGAALAQAADAVIVAPVPFGPLNAALLGNALGAQRAGVPVFCLDGEGFAARDHTQGTAVAAWNSLAHHGAVMSPNLAALLQSLNSLISIPESHSWKP